MIITIDGPAAAGKGTLASQLAQKYKLAYFDTGMVYRAPSHSEDAAEPCLSSDSQHSGFIRRIASACTGGTCTFASSVFCDGKGGLPYASSFHAGKRFS